MRHDSQGTTSPFLLEIKNFLRSYLSHKFLVSPPTTASKTANNPSTTNISSSLDLPTPQQPQQPPPTRTPVQEVDEYGDTKNPQPARDGQKNLQPTHHTPSHTPSRATTHAKPGNAHHISPPTYETRRQLKMCRHAGLPQPAHHTDLNFTHDLPSHNHRTKLIFTHAKPGNNTRQAWQCTPHITSNICCYLHLTVAL